MYITPSDLKTSPLYLEKRRSRLIEVVFFPSKVNASLCCCVGDQQPQLSARHAHSSKPAAAACSSRMMGQTD